MPIHPATRHVLVVTCSVIPGDNETPSWNELMRNLLFTMAVQNTTTLIAPHHGREAGFCTDLLDLMKPSLVVISDGEACDTSATSAMQRRRADVELLTE
jgi:hypothetical protein